MTTGTSTFHWLDECSVPLQVYQHLTSETPSDAELSIHSRNLPESDAKRERNDSSDPTGEDMWPLERDISGSAQVTDAHSIAAPSHRIGTCYLDPDTGETVMPGDFFGEKELRWRPDKTTAPETSSSAGSCVVESCPECGTVTDIEYGTVKDKPDCQGCEPEPARFAHEAPANLAVGARNEHPDTFSVPFGVQSWLFEALIETEVDHLHEIIDDHHDEIVEMARKRHQSGYVDHGSKGYQWDAKTRLRNVLEELSDAPTYLTMGPIE